MGQKKYKDINHFFKSEFGVDETTVSKTLIAEGVDNIKRQYDFASDEEMLDRLAYSPSVRHALFEEIKVTETWFFRSEPSFEFLDIWMQNKSHRRELPISILSAPSSSGEEPYSIAILAEKNRLSSSQCRIDAVDMSSEIIKKAKQGVYSNNSFRSKMISPYKSFFEEKNTNEFHLSEEIKKRVKFSEANINQDLSLRLRGKYDVIFCRNVLIYFTEEAQLNAVIELKKLLKDDGILITGFSESLLFLNNGFVKTGGNMSFALKLEG
jgi:chemotaxis protein methyltransferase WspC